MKRIVVFVVFLTVGLAAISQNVNLETLLSADTNKVSLFYQRIDIVSKHWEVKYDHFANNQLDALGLILSGSNIAGDHKLTLLKTGNNTITDQYSVNWTIGDDSPFTLLDLGVTFGQKIDAIFRAGFKFSNRYMTASTYVFTQQVNGGWSNEESDGLAADNYLLGAFHPKYFYIGAAEKNLRSFWGFAGTKNLKNFGTFNIFNYQSNGSFWLSSETGFGEVDQEKFGQDHYAQIVDQLAIPQYFTQHFSPICLAGNYSLKVEGRKIGKIHNYEVLFGKNLEKYTLRVAVGLGTEITAGGNQAKIGPVFEAYKIFQKQIVELRYDCVKKIASAYLIMKF
ncbi:MAG: hypothetical protein ACOYMB_04470 [Patescibacteria group bacterium]